MLHLDLAGLITILGACAILHAFGCQSARPPSISESPFGEIGGEPVSLYTLENQHGVVAKITNYGGIVTELHLPDAGGEKADVVLGFDTLQAYVDHSPYFGCIVGRVGNRIADGRFTLDGAEYQLAQNNGPHHLHGGDTGWDKHLWEAHANQTANGPSLTLSLHSTDGDENYPGNVNAIVVYTLTNDNELRIEMTATTDRATPINMVHHSYWNLAGHGSGTILDHLLQLNADQYTPGDATLIPTGEIAPVAQTPFDFTDPKAIAADINQLPPSGDDPGGYDLNYVVDGSAKELRFVARAVDPGSGRSMEIYANQPGVQFYSGNFLDGVSGKGGVVYDKHDGFCLETQKFPDAINKQGRPGWPNVVLRPGEQYRHVMIHRFSAE